jgi:hypothetical protein
LQGTLTFAVVKFDAVGNTTKPASTPTAPNPIPFPPNTSITVAPAGARSFDLYFAENQQCHPCFLEVQQFVDATTSYYHCTEIGVFSRLNDRTAYILVRKGPNEAILQPDTVKARLTTGFGTRGFTPDTIEVPDTAFTLNENSQYTVRVILKDNPDNTASQMAYILQTENVGSVLGAEVVSVSIDGSGEDNPALATETLIAILVGCLVGLGALLLVCLWVRHRNATGQPLCCCQPKSTNYAARYR